MKVFVIALGMTAAIMMDLVRPAVAQVVIDRNHSQSVDSGEADMEAQALQDWNRRHNAPNGWGERRNNFGPRDVIRLLERRGYRVRDVNDVGERYLVKASRDGDDVLVSVSRSGEIMGVVHDRY
ncbi:hypothetical protein LJR009_002938 [Bosea sp. LjRoot9]|uniref:hypothetical protein n=1 Tax=Bosea sp. LjRoot9 TaxID=3342341 RepID=UPI003ECE96CC